MGSDKPLEKAEDHPSDRVPLCLNSYWKFLADGLAFALLEYGDVSELVRCERAIKQRATHGNGPSDSFPAFFQAGEELDDSVKGRVLELLDLRAIARGLVGEDGLSLLGL